MSLRIRRWLSACLFTAWAAAALAQEQICVRCHGSVELLSDFAPQRAASLHIEGVGGPHADFECGDCHDGFDIFPHESTSETWHCSNCHDDVATIISQSPHAALDGNSCTSCHGIHDVRAPGGEAFDSNCTACHQGRALAPGDVHLDLISCVDCHGSHDIRSHRDGEGRVTGLSEAERCGSCHDGPFADWIAGDIHHTRLLESGVGSPRPQTGATIQEPSPPSCSSCHGGHGVRAVATAEFARASSERCIACHADFGRRSADTYHTRAVRLGRPDAASCTDCHGAHGILPAEDPDSQVHPDRVLATCQQCHERATSLFASYDAHPVPTDRDRNPALFYSFLFMNVLLVGVLGVFSLHTLIWWIRIRIDQRREGGEG